jgi:ABC-type sugar transport system ATPase subunit
MAEISLEGACVVSGGVRRLDDVSMVVPAGAFVGVVGGSGSGKSTLLRAIGGLDRLTAGRICFDGVDVRDSSPGVRDVGMVFQTPALFDRLSVRGNVEFPLVIRRHAADDVRDRVDAESRAMRIEQLLDRNPKELSQGEQQMVQIVRALVRVPSVLLLDEPFAPLDERLRDRMRTEIGMLQDGYGVTTIMSTNDPRDLDALTSLLAVLDEGRLVQFGATEVVRRSPGSMLAAAATGEVSFVTMTVIADTRGHWLMCDADDGELIRIRVWATAFAAYSGREVRVGIRPEHLVVHPDGSVPAVVDQRIPIPPGSVRCRIGGARLTATVPPGVSAAVGDRVRLRIEHLVAFDPTTEFAL